MTDFAPLRRALLSVSDKTGLVEFATALAEQGVQLLSTGGTARALRDAGLEVRDVSDVTGFPEMMDGRVKTLHPVVHGGLLALRDNDEHVAAMQAHDIGAIDLVVVNLYPFEETVAKGAPYDEVIENIDIGGPAMIRSAAKNHGFVTVVVDVQDYATVLQEMDQNDGQTGYALRQRLAQVAYARTAAYDTAVSTWMANAVGEPPRRRSFGGTLAQSLRYGENPHQEAAFYTDGSARPGVATAIQHQGKELSYNNINDTDAAFELVSEFAGHGPTCAIIKHANPCGVASGENLVAAWQTALAADPVSAFGGIIAMNRPLDAKTATAVASIFTEVVIAPDASDEAKAIMAAKPNLRLLITGDMPDRSTSSIKIKSVAGGFLSQSRDGGMVSADDLKIVTKRAPSAAEIANMLFAWKVTKHVKSNAIVFVKDNSTVGIGAGQMSRVDAARIAVHKASDIAKIHGWSKSHTIGSVAASDAFFPFADGLEALIKAGATAVIQPGGSVKDNDVIAAADAAGIAMAFTGMRHFNH